MARAHRRRTVLHARSKTPRRIAATVAGLIVLAAAFLAFALARSLPAPRVTLVTTSVTFAPSTSHLSAPSGVGSILAVGGVGSIVGARANTQTPLASVTKIMSALVVLHDHPLSTGSSGPSITVTAADVATYEQEKTRGDSVVAVQAGEQITELQGLEAALIPSGDNIMQLLADWDSGTTTAFVGKMNALARSIGLRRTHYAGPSGVNPASVSTPSDQLRLAEVAMENPVFASIVAMPQVTLPLAGVQYNVNADLGTDGIVGVKTGWLPEGGACLVFAADDRLGNRKVTIFGALMGQQGGSPIPSVLALAERLVVSTKAAVRIEHLPAGMTVATLSSPTGSSVPVVTSSGVALLGWGGARAHISLRPSGRLSLPLKAGEHVGEIVVSFGAERRVIGLQTASAMPAPSLGWRLTHF